MRTKLDFINEIKEIKKNLLIKFILLCRILYINLKIFKNE